MSFAHVDRDKNGKKKLITHGCFFLKLKFFNSVSFAIQLGPVYVAVSMIA